MEWRSVLEVFFIVDLLDLMLQLLIDGVLARST